MLLLWVDLLLLGEKHYNYYAKRICNLTSLWVKKGSQIHPYLFSNFLIKSLLGHEQWRQWYATAPRKHEPKK
jgi:hypothetical protein